MYKFRVEKGRYWAFSAAEMPLALSEKDSKIFAKALLNDTEPSETLKEAAKVYKKHIEVE